MKVTIDELAARLDRALPFSRVGTATSPRTMRCGALVERADGDPLAGWRAATGRQLEARHGTHVRPHVPAAFVLQWWCEVVATPTAYAARLGPWVLRGPGGLGFELGQGLHPERLVLLPDLAVELVEPVPDRLSRARAAYREVVDPVVRTFAPDVKMSSRQRWGIVEDTWATALRRAMETSGTPTAAQPWRTSCCFVYALPGLRACAACPRLRRT